MAAAKAKLRQQKVTDTDSGFLRRARLRKQVTRDKYAESWDSFLDYCVDHTLLPGRSSRFVTMHQLDCALEAFGEHLFLGGASKYTLTCALQNVNIVYPCWPTKGWGNLEPGASKDPCPFEVASWIALDMVRRGLCYFAAAVMLSFDNLHLMGSMKVPGHIVW